MQQHRIGPWLFVRAGDRLPFGTGRFMYTFARAHESAPARVLELLRGFGSNEAEAVLEAAETLIDDRGLPLLSSAAVQHV